MRKFRKALAAAMMLSLPVLGSIPAQAADIPTTHSEKMSAQLSEQQKRELASLYKDILEKQKEVVSKYVKYGVVTEEKGNEIVARLDKRYQKLEENGFIPPRHKHERKQPH
ncbi:YckD family protein [Aneurinibacillus terranovensis]|uniref:YckD family protein n=1 Tax=Aneurinibacillus terranovensis TaxID=278991 RepID=UPI0004125B2A|nr:YckD family protein [Aneurinibacillus terranovensis]